MKTSIWFRVLTVAVTIAVFNPVFAAATQAADAKPFNRIVIIIDRSGSFMAHLVEAHDIAWKYIRDLSNTSTRDEVYIIGVDKASSQIIYIKGIRSRRDAKAQFDTAFANTTAGLGTDWVSGIRKGAADLHLMPKPAGSHLLVFGDLLVDDEKDAAGRSVRRFDRLEGFDWSSLSGVTCSFWFVNDGVRDVLLQVPNFQKLNAAIYSVESHARAKDIKPPSPVRSGTSSDPAFGWAMYGVAIIAILVVLGLVMRRPAPARQR